jgi:hypothetical protein
LSKPIKTRVREQADAFEKAWLKGPFPDHYGVHDMMREAADYIDQLETDNAALSILTPDAMLQTSQEANAELRAVVKNLHAALVDARSMLDVYAKADDLMDVQKQPAKDAAERARKTEEEHRDYII